MEASAVHQVHTVNITGFFRSIVGSQTDERILEMAGGSSVTVHCLQTVEQRLSLYHSLLSPVAVEMYKIILHVRKFKTAGIYSQQLDLLVTLIDIAVAAGDHISVAVRGITHNHLKSGPFIFHINLQSLCFLVLLHIGRRHILQRRLAVINLISCILKPGDSAAVRILGMECRGTIIAASVHRQLLRPLIREEGLGVLLARRHIIKQLPFLSVQHIINAIGVLQLLAVVHMHGQLAVINTDHIAGTRCLQIKHIILFVKLNSCCISHY